MKIITVARDMQRTIRAEKRAGKSVGFVPTMGYLHEGHRRLLTNARRENDLVVLSIFVNPTQFGPNEDFETYPRDMNRDEKIAEEAGVDFIFFPAVQEMYHDEPSVNVTVQNRTAVLCGRKRPGHFDGVATVLTKLFHIIQPDKAYFGMKDAQQIAVIDGLIKDFHFDIELVPVPTVREEDGLAKSSRNVYLHQEERREAKELYQSLQLAKRAIEDGVASPARIAGMIREHLEASTSGEVDYIEIYSYPDLEPLEKLKGKIIIALAVKFKQARLIDNITMALS
ncbi:pantoate--beta-alanine ligase [Peribacillus cavernae]|uniref:Pantothenate synthetase n=1 Tax=Peribacillus cavernae TaxID=1674310 RepID=A0A433HLU2_9BACI|nr:pantoate--beta-alanine ligase [Peribacillus cavernae]MDQ0218962.1 pantoate--beta-alanine ligase [Peribacillus cavernae]RUQ29330.1 pantoate--beta-alanine ligase [Peribacillus cavernae]